MCISSMEETYAAIVKKQRGRPKLSEEVKEARKALKKPTGRPKGSTKPEHLKKKRVPSPNGYKGNGKSPGYSGWQYHLKFKDPTHNHVFQTMKEISEFYNISIGKVRKLKDLDWNLGNLEPRHLAKLDKDFVEQFEDLDGVIMVNISKKHTEALQKEFEQLKKQEEEENKRWAETKINNLTGDYGETNEPEVRQLLIDKLNE